MIPADPVNRPAHYQAICHCPNCGHAIEAISITERFSFVLGNVLKYALRAGRKEGASAAQDLAKCAWYATRAADQAQRAAGDGPTAPQGPFCGHPPAPRPPLRRGCERTPE